MRRYWVYLLGAAGGIERVEVLACENDTSAINEVEKKGAAQPRELWQHRRLVRSFDPARREAPAAARAGAERLRA